MIYVDIDLAAETMVPVYGSSPLVLVSRHQHQHQCFGRRDE